MCASYRMVTDEIHGSDDFRRQKWRTRKDDRPLRLNVFQTMGHKCVGKVRGQITHGLRTWSTGPRTRIHKTFP